MGVPLGVEAGDTVPHGCVGHDTDQLTPLAVESLLTVAVNFAVPPASTVAEAAESDTLTGGGGGPLLLLPLPPPQPQRNRAGVARAAKSVAAFLRVGNRSLITPPIVGRNRNGSFESIAPRHWGEILGREAGQVNEDTELGGISERRLVKNLDCTHYRTELALIRSRDSPTSSSSLLVNWSKAAMSVQSNGVGRRAIPYIVLYCLTPAPFRRYISFNLCPPCPARVKSKRSGCVQASGGVCLVNRVRIPSFSQETRGNRAPGRQFGVGRRKSHVSQKRRDMGHPTDSWPLV